MTIVRRNERSWAIDLISKINGIARKNDLVIKKAGGENTISTGRGNTMFPDVLLYGNEEQTLILQGWELKMPDVPIEEETFIRDAQRKAVALGLNSCLIWNFTYAVLYGRGDGNSFTKLKQWNAASHIRTRQDVETCRADWERQLEEIIVEMNEYFVSGQFCNAPLGQVISEATVTTLIQRNKDITAQSLETAAFRDAVMAAHINHWWRGVKAEYAQDEANQYKAYAKTILLNWANRILFAHMIKHRQNGARIVDEIDDDKTPDEGNRIFQRITEKCDFYHIFTAVDYNELLPAATWRDLVLFSCFLRHHTVAQLNQEALQNILEGSVATGKREINGQYTTPPELAKLLVHLTVRDWTDTILDCCCGTGTIPRAALQMKKTRMTAKQAVETVWACDKNRYPLQVANLGMTDADTIRVANRLFQHNALTLTVGETIAITNPETGHMMELSLPRFGAVVSNLPFVPFEMIPDDDKREIAGGPFVGSLDGRSDLYCYIAAGIADVMKEGGMLGVIVSNSWLGTKAGVQFIETLKKRYRIRQVHLSGKGRWFQNASVVTTILILEKTDAHDAAAPTQFWLWKRSLTQLAQETEAENTLLQAALLEKELDPTVSVLSCYTQDQIHALLALKVCYNALFHHVDWLLAVQEKIVPIHQVYHVFRGSRRGWDPLFYPQAGEHRIEPQYLKKVLVNARNVNRLMAVADRDAFCCGVSKDELERRGHDGALEWIARFADQKNGVGKALPEVLKRTGMEWYELQGREMAEVFTMMNPDQRLFFAKFETPSFVNQRLIGLTHKEAYPDEALNHALLNAMFTMFYIEASGFGRGLGVLDVNKERIANCYMLNPQLVSDEDREEILAAFEKLKSREIKKVSEELSDETRLAFERTVLKSFGIEGYFEPIKSSLLSMQEARATARE